MLSQTLCSTLCEAAECPRAYAPKASSTQLKVNQLTAAKRVDFRSLPLQLDALNLVGCIWAKCVADNEMHCYSNCLARAPHLYRKALLPERTLTERVRPPGRCSTGLFNQAGSSQLKSLHFKVGHTLLKMYLVPYNQSDEGAAFHHLDRRSRVFACPAGVLGNFVIVRFQIQLSARELS